MVAPVEKLCRSASVDTVDLLRFYPPHFSIHFECYWYIIFHHSALQKAFGLAFPDDEVLVIRNRADSYI